MSRTVRNSSHIGIIHLFGRLFRTTRWSSVRKPHIPFDAVFHTLFEHGLKSKEKDVLCHQNREILPDMVSSSIDMYK
jgi:hypothetical protein